MLTHGWSIITVLLAVATLAYLGTSIHNRAPEPCESIPGLACIDRAFLSAASDTIAFVLRNNFGVALANFEVLDASRCKMSEAHIFAQQADRSYLETATVENERNVRIQITCGTGIDPGKFKSTITIRFLNTDSQLTHTETISITGVAA